MFFGLDAEKLIVLAVIAAVVLGPEKLPRIAQQASRFVARAREWTTEAKSRVKEEMGDDVDWSQLDPRQYDPRRIVRQALLDDASVPRERDSTPPPFKPDVRGVLPTEDAQGAGVGAEPEGAAEEQVETGVASSESADGAVDAR